MEYMPGHWAARFTRSSQGEGRADALSLSDDCVQRHDVGRPQISFEGSAVADPVVGLHDNVTVFDFSSLYPSIQHYICHSTLIPREE